MKIIEKCFFFLVKNIFLFVHKFTFFVIKNQNEKEKREKNQLNKL